MNENFRNGFEKVAFFDALKNKMKENREKSKKMSTKMKVLNTAGAALGLGLALKYSGKKKAASTAKSFLR